MKKVVKFGGSSLASAEQFKKVGNIIRKEESRRYVIPSAPGKRTPDDTKVTDMLYSCYGQAILGEDAEKDFEEQLEAIKERYNSIIRGLDLELSLDEEFKTIRTNFSKKIGRDYAASRGEYLNGIIMAAYLGYEFIDAAEVIVFDENGNFDGDKTHEILSARLENTDVQSFRDSTGQNLTEVSRHFPVADLILQDRSLQRLCMQTCMRTGPMYLVS